mmetsp:Transcript_61927/g.136145  ORF Transcript_61927/g.136145 Transcript_61927/m.136145 type:complete len:584 (-) Transcript_61927:9-1760(-)
MAPSFEELLQSLASEHALQLEKKRAEICTLKEELRPLKDRVPLASEHALQLELEKLREENTTLHEQLRSAQSLALAAPAPLQSNAALTRPALLQEQHTRSSFQEWVHLQRAKSSADIGKVEQSEEVLKAIRTSKLKEEHSCWSRLEKEVKSVRFELGLGLLIMINTVIMAMESQHEGLKAQRCLEDPQNYDMQGSDLWPQGSATFEVLERVMMSLFTLDLLLRLAVLRRRFFRSAFNWIDVIIVVGGLLDWIAHARMVVDPKTARLFRLVRAARVLSLHRVFAMQDSLQLMLKAMTASFSTLFWALCVLVIIQCVAGMVVSQLLREFVLDESEPEAARLVIFEYYGTFSRSMITMFEISLANWSPPCRVLIENVGEVYGSVIVVYRCVIGFAVLHVIAAVFVSQTMKVTQEDNDIMICERKRAQISFERKLKKLFFQLDISGDGLVSWEEFKLTLSERPDLKTFMSALGIDPIDLEGTFKLLDDGTGQLSVDEFIKGASRIRGHAKSIDTAHLLAYARRAEARLDDVMQANRRVRQEIASHFSGTHVDDRTRAGSPGAGGLRTSSLRSGGLHTSSLRSGSLAL